MMALVSAVDSALLAFVWQGVAVAMVLWVALAALRTRSANARYLTSCSALVVLGALPVATACLNYSVPAPAKTAPFTIAAMAVAGRSLQGNFDWFAAAQAWVLPLWGCGVLLLSLRLLWGCRKVSGLKRQGEAAQPEVLAMVERLARRLRVTRPVRVLMSSLADGPSVVGWLRPVLLLPAATVLGLSAEQLEAVLAHELAHIRRHDYLVNLLQMLMETLFFYHPAVWWMSRRIREERELCCDDIAVSMCGDAVCYARALAALERMRMGQPALMFGAALGANGGALQYRIERLLGIARREQAPSRLPGMVAMCFGLACFVPTVNPVKAQAPLPPLVAPASPRAIAFPDSPRVLPVQRRKPATRLVAQVTQPAAAGPVPRAAGEDLLVEVSVDAYGTVNDARVISGRMESRRNALITALGKRFPPGGPPTEFIVIPPVRRSSLFLTGPGGIQRPYSTTEAQNTMVAATEQIQKLRVQQADASEKGGAQLQELIDNLNQSIAQMQATLGGENPLVGKPLEDIRIQGSIADDAGARLLQQLPVHLHDVLSADAMAATLQAVKRDYPSADVYFGFFGSAHSGKAGLVVAVR